MEEPEAEFLADGITEGIINRVSQFPNLRVMSWNSVLHYKGKPVDARAVGRELGIQAVLIGYLRRQGDQLIVSTELIDAHSERHLWGELFAQKLSNVGSLEREVSERIGEKLQMALTSAQRDNLVKRNTESSEAYQDYLRGLFYWNKSTLPDLNKALQYFRSALDKDPLFALAYAGLGQIYYEMSSIYWEAPEAMSKVRAAAEKALALNPSLPEAHAVLALIAAQYDREWIKADRLFRSAIMLNPNYAWAHHWYGIYLVEVGRAAEAKVELRRAQELDPLSLGIAVSALMPLVYTHPSERNYDRVERELRRVLEIDPHFRFALSTLGCLQVLRGRFLEGIELLKRISELDPTANARLGRLAWAYAESGQPEEARRILANLDEDAKRTYVDSWAIALAYAGLKENDRAIGYLLRACEEHSEELNLIAFDPKFDGLRSNPRFGDVLSCIGMRQ